MHPNSAFGWDNLPEILNFVSERAFAHVFTGSGEDLFVVHIPILVTEGRLRFHVGKRNRIADRLDGRRALISVSGLEAYHSANWYASSNHVPTWHYEAVEIEGNARQLSDDELVELLDESSAIFEARFSPERPWTRSKMSPGKFEAMTQAIAGFEADPAAIRGARKFNHHKSGDDLAATIAGQKSVGRDDIVAAIRAAEAND